jgi:hypothetical protein
MPTGRTGDWDTSPCNKQELRCFDEFCGLGHHAMWAHVAWHCAQAAPPEAVPCATMTAPRFGSGWRIRIRGSSAIAAGNAKSFGQSSEQIWGHQRFIR